MHADMSNGQIQIAMYQPMSTWMETGMVVLGDDDQLLLHIIPAVLKTLRRRSILAIASSVPNCWWQHDSMMIIEKQKMQFLLHWTYSTSVTRQTRAGNQQESGDKHPYALFILMLYMQHHHYWRVAVMWGRNPAHIVAFIRWVFWPIWSMPFGIRNSRCRDALQSPDLPVDNRMNCSSSHVRMYVSRPVRRVRRRKRVENHASEEEERHRHGAGGRDA